MARTSGRARSVLMALALAGAVGWPHLDAQQAQPTAVGTGMIAGRVVDEDTREPVPGAMVSLAAIVPPAARESARPAAIRPVKADSQGRFVFTGLIDGGYALLAQSEGYAARSAPQGTYLTKGAAVTDLTLPITKFGTITGTVRDDSGDPVVGIEVFAFRRTTTQGRPPVLSSAGRSRTDDRGQYRHINLPAGNYYVCACSREPIPFDGQLLTTLAARPLELLAIAGRAAKAGADAASLDNTLRTFPPTFHPNTTLAGRATPVKVSGTQPQSAVDIEVTPVPASRVSGLVMGLPNGGLTANAIRLTPLGDIPEAVAITQLMPMLVQPDGRFDFAGVAPGQYLLDVRFTPSAPGGGPSGAALAFIGGRGTAAGGARGGGPPADAMWASQPVVVGDEDVTGLVIGLQPGAVITGRLEFVGATPPPLPQALQRGTAVQLNSMESPPRSTSHAAQVAPDATFRIGGVAPGRFVVFPIINVPGWPTLRSVTMGGVDITDTIIDIDGRDIANLVLTLTDVPMAEIRGTVSGDARAWIRLFPAERRYWEEPFGAYQRFKSCGTDNNSCTLTRVPEGEYFVVAATEPGLDWMDKATLEAMARSARRVRVANGDNVVIEVKR